MSRRTITTGIRWDQVPSALESEDWETNEDGDGQIRRVYLGSTMRLAPSGKYYMPWACSNLDPCPRCGGSGNVHGNTRPRDRSKARNRLAAALRKADRMIAANPTTGRAYAIAAYPARRRWERIANGSTCSRCGGLGSHEAHDDETYWELLESEASDHGYFVDHSEDGESVFIAESRAMPDDELDDNDEDDDTAEPTFTVVEYSSGFAVRHNPTGAEHWLSDGVDAIGDEDGNPINPGSPGFVDLWTASMNSDESETMEAYFPELIDNDN